MYETESILTRQRIYELAYAKLVDIWADQCTSNDNFFKNTGVENDLGKERENRLWKQIKELQNLMQ